MADLQYPIGRFSFPESTTPEERRAWTREIARAPHEMRAAVAGLSAEQLDTPYRPGGWTVRQVVHHVPDSHMNAFVRFKLALTEDQPVVKPYDESRWATLADTGLPVEPSLDLLEALHVRWVRLLDSMSDSDYQRTFVHPESGTLRLDQWLAQYAWHGRHHVAHITSLRKKFPGA
ncbi:MAG: metal-dependent hydrolase [Bryobacterales bacterium]|nr:metal-dependent hydrolase [Bryobacterales bacterium]